MFNLHTADAIASSLLIKACVALELTMEYSVMNPAWDTQPNEFPDDQQDHASLRMSK